jgi:hypothetical protein
VRVLFCAVVQSALYEDDDDDDEEEEESDVEDDVGVMEMVLDRFCDTDGEPGGDFGPGEGGGVATDELMAEGRAGTGGAAVVGVGDAGTSGARRASVATSLVDADRSRVPTPLGSESDRDPTVAIGRGGNRALPPLPDAMQPLLLLVGSRTSLRMTAITLAGRGGTGGSGLRGAD